MPNYVYDCKKCNRVFTLTRSINERDSAAICPKCSTPTTKRIFTAPIVLRRHDDSQTPAPANPNTQRNVRPPFLVENVQIRNFRHGTGMRVGGDVRVISKNVHLIDNQTAIEVTDDGQLEDYGTIIE
jgi:putative FmdB family regulatory protein